MTFTNTALTEAVANSPEVGDTVTVNGVQGTIENVQSLTGLTLVGVALEDGPDGKGLYTVVLEG